MTDKQIQQAKATLPQWKNGKAPILTPEQNQLRRELQCRDMINSILCYKGKEGIMNNEYIADYIDDLGCDIVKRLCDEQITDFEKAIVKKNVHTDSEGISYNSIIWADDK
jgi:hypothetical protein